MDKKHALVAQTKSANSETSRISHAAITEINASYRRAQSSAKEYIEEIRNCGDLLLKAKASVGHGNWTRWLQENFDGSQDTAQNWMLVAQHWFWLSARAYPLGRPSVDGMVKALRARKVMSPRERAIADVIGSVREAVEGWEDDQIKNLNYAVEDVLDAWLAADEAAVRENPQRKRMHCGTDDADYERWPIQLAIWFALLGSSSNTAKLIQQFLFSTRSMRTNGAVRM
jgi:hypothetical protein